jgi:hypothetical protein
VLGDAILIIGKEESRREIKKLNKVFMFLKNTNVKVVKVGSEWVEDYVNDKFHIKGYFYQQDDFYGLSYEIMDYNDLQIVGNVAKSQYQVKGVSINKHKSNSIGIDVFKFSALNYNRVHLK